VLLYFAYGVYSLFIHPDEGEEALAVPAWLRVQQIGQLKQIVAEVIIVILFALFLRFTMQSFSGKLTRALSWLQIAALNTLPVSTVLLGLSLKQVELHPKPLRPLKKAPESEGKNLRQPQGITPSPAVAAGGDGQGRFRLL